MMLLLFDIDGTLLLSQRAGALAMLDAGRQIIGREVVVDGLEFAGRLDRQIWRDIAEANGVARPDALFDEFRRIYFRMLSERLEKNPTAYTLPGVVPLIEHVSSSSRFTLGLLTGNFPETGRLKIQSAGLNPDLFKIAAWGSDGEVRRDLPKVAMTRYQSLTGNAISPRRVVIIGDTPNDIDCARANGCRSLGVASGPGFSVDDLASHGPDLVVSDLSDTGRIVAWFERLLEEDET